jgi:hypothetical protein
VKRVDLESSIAELMSFAQIASDPVHAAFFKVFFFTTFVLLERES